MDPFCCQECQEAAMRAYWRNALREVQAKADDEPHITRGEN